MALLVTLVQSNKNSTCALTLKMNHRQFGVKEISGLTIRVGQTCNEQPDPGPHGFLRPVGYESSTSATTLDKGLGLIILFQAPAGRFGRWFYYVPGLTPGCAFVDFSCSSPFLLNQLFSALLLSYRGGSTK